MLRELRTLRVFISSTFRDMHAERDHLVSVVFPALRERLDPYRIDLIDIDLRWGITAQQMEDERVLSLCLEKIDEARPYFIGLLGQRYGWIPDSVSRDAEERHGWLQRATGKSITELEILHGVLKDPGMKSRSFFYFRDPAALETVPADIRAVYRSDRSEEVGKLEELKDRIRATGLPVMDGYPAHWDPDAYDRARGRQGCLGGLDEFGRRVLEDLWSSIREEFDLPDEPPPEPTGSHLQREHEHHVRFIDKKLRGYVIRRDVHLLLLDYLEGLEDLPLLLHGPPGSGKSSIIAFLARRLQEEAASARSLILPHFAGASAGSTSLRNLLTRVLDLLDVTFGIENDAAVELRELQKTFREALMQVPPDWRLVLLIDGLDQFDSGARVAQLRWLPARLPPNVRIVVSSVRPRSEASDAVRVAQLRGFETLEVPPLHDDERREIAREVPAIAAKTLDESQLALLLQNEATRNPLFLTVALEELRNFGSFERLNDRIRAFPGTDSDRDPVEALFEQLLQRVEVDFDRELSREVLRLLTVARRGLREEELRALVEDLDRRDDLFPVLRQLRPYLMRRGRVLAFFHQALQLAAEDRYVSSRGRKAAAHARLARYFHAQPDFLPQLHPREERIPNRRKVDELPIHLLGSRQIDELAAQLQVLSFLESKVEAGMVLELVEDLRRTEQALEPEDARHYILHVLRRAISHDSSFLLRHPDALFQQLWNLGWWYDAPQTARYFRVSDSAPSSYLPPWERSRPKVCELLERWRDAPRPSPWLRSLRPPEDLYTPSVVVLRGHEEELNHVAFSPDGSVVASASNDRTIRIWSTDSGEETAVLRGHESWVRHVAFSPDGNRVASASDDGTVRLWSVSNGEELAVLRGHGGVPGRPFEVAWVVFAPTGSRLASASWDFTVRLWSTESGEELAVLEGHRGCINQVDFSPDGRRLVSASDDGTARLWSAQTGECLSILQGHEDRLECVAFSPDGQRIASAADDATIRLWSGVTGEPLDVLEGHEAQVEHVAFSPDGRRLASASWDHTVRLWSTRTRVEVAVLSGHETTAYHTAFSTDGSRLVSASADNTLRLWSAETGDELSVLHGHTEEVRRGVFSPHGDRVASCSADGTVRIWTPGPTQERVVRRREHAAPVRRLIFSPEGTRIASVPAPPYLIARLWSALTGERLAAVPLVEAGKPAGKEVDHLSFSADGRLLAAVSDLENEVVLVWSADTGELLAELRGHEQPVLHVRFSPGGTCLASASWDGTVRLWVPQTGEPRATLDGQGQELVAMVFSPDGTRLASISWGSGIQLWSTRTGSEIAALPRDEGAVRDLVFSPDGTRLAAACGGRVRVWAIAEGEGILLKDEETVAGRLAFSPDGSLLAFASDDGTVYIWSSDTGDERRILEGTEGTVEQLAFSPDGARIGCVSGPDFLPGYTERPAPPGTVLSSRSFLDSTRGRVVRIWSVAAGDEVTSIDGAANVERALDPRSPRLMVYTAGGWSVRSSLAGPDVAVSPHRFDGTLAHPGGRPLWGSWSGRTMYLHELQDS